MGLMGMDSGEISCVVKITKARGERMRLGVERMWNDPAGRVLLRKARRCGIIEYQKRDGVTKIKRLEKENQ